MTSVTKPGRQRAEQKTHDRWRTTQSVIVTASRLLTLAHDLPHHTRQEILADLRAYERECWRRTGRRARLRLPRRLVTRLRALRVTLHRGVWESKA